MAFSPQHQLELPDSFPVNEMNAFMDAVRRILLSPTKSDAWKEFGGASNLIGWRFRACHEDMTNYIDSWKAYGANVSFEEMYRRERALFGMFTAGVSCIDSTCYALSALASHPKLLGLPFGEDEQRKCNPSRFKDRLTNVPGANALSAALDVLTKSKEWADWKELRNRMNHRSNLPRITQGAVGCEPPPAKALHFAATSSTPTIESDISHLEDLFAWLANTLRQLLKSGLELATTSSPNS